MCLSAQWEAAGQLALPWHQPERAQVDTHSSLPPFASPHKSSFQSRPSAEIHRTCAVRILAHGANPMTLHGDVDAKSHEDVLWQFLRNTEPLNDGEADETIEMDISEDLEQTLARAIDGVVRMLGLPPPMHSLSLHVLYLPSTMMNIPFLPPPLWTW